MLGSKGEEDKKSWRPGERVHVSAFGWFRRHCRGSNLNPCMMVFFLFIVCLRLHRVPSWFFALGVRRRRIVCNILLRTI